jgi:DNA polymerase I-like protein with 3'-5' exonuclease and polymerase domains
MLGWEPTVLTEKGNVKIDETILKTIDIPEAKLLIDFFLIAKRIVMINAWVDAVQKDGRVHGKVNSCGAISGRMTHFSPNMAQIPANYSKWGTECRELWIAEEGNILVGCDASGLELRMLAHYINDEDFTNEILNGDIHTYNQRLAGIDTRDKAKTFIYAFIYGAGDGKLGQIIKGTTYDGAKLRERFLLALPKLEKLARAVRYATRKGYIKGLDGRKLYPRSPHSSLNLLLQNAGAIIMKRALTYLSGSDIIKDQKGYFVGNIHDEIQMEVEKGYEEQLGREAIQAIIKAGENYDLKIPLGGEYNIGHSWSQTH